MSEEQQLLISPNLPFGDINLVVLTDVHSWVGGHPNEKELDVSYGDVLSFYHHLHRYCQQNEKDIWLVQNGDWIDGTGLAMDGDPSHLVPLIQKMDFDVLNTGNHELYRSEVIDYMIRPGGFIDWWGDRYLSSNVYLRDEKTGKRGEPLGRQYSILEGKNSKILVFGFLFNLPNPSDKVIVQHVQEAVKERWFHQALTETKDYNAILVMIHAGHNDPSVTEVHRAIRNTLKDDLMPIQFIAGHTHYRRYAVLEKQSTVVEAGRYLDTIGWVSFANRDTVRQRERLLQQAWRDLVNGDYDNSTTSPSAVPIAITEDVSPSLDPSTVVVDDHFQHVFLDANVATLRQTLGISNQDKFDTTAGKELKKFIKETRNKMGLTNKIGCAPRDYRMNVSLTQANSLWKLFSEQVVQHVLMKDSTVPRVMLLEQGSWRYDLVGGEELTYDDVIAVSPYNDPLYLVDTVPGDVILRLSSTMNNKSSEEDRYFSMLPVWILSGAVIADQPCELYTVSSDLTKIQDTLRELYPTLGKPIEQNLTSTTIWFSFVINSWHCFGGVLDNKWWSQTWNQQVVEATDIHKRNVTMVLYIMAIVACFLSALMVYACHHICCGVIRIPSRKENYGEMMTSFHDDEDGDDGHDSQIDYDGDNEETDDECETPVRIV